VRVTVPPRIEAPEAGSGTFEASVTPNGLDTDVSAEALNADGTWRVLGTTHVPATTASVPVSLALGGLTPGTAQVRLTAANEAGSASTSSVTVTTPGPPPVSTPVPVEGKTVVVTVLSGSVALKVPRQRAYKELTGTAIVPMKTLVNTTSGRVKLAAQAGGKTQIGRFDSGKFRVTQLRNGITQLALAGPLVCSKRARAAAKPKPKKRRLWGSDNGGKYRTHGQNSVATVRGTRWLTEDTCAGTRIHVSEGSVRVWDTKGGRSVILRAGQERFTPR
jgi:hypothetical protein